MPRLKTKSASLGNSARDSGKNKLYSKKARDDDDLVFTKEEKFLGSLISSVSWSPDWIQEPYNWAGHMPFAYWLMTESQPKIFVELGTHSGNSYFSFCQAVRDRGLITRCYAVDTWKGDGQAGSYGEDVFEMVNRHNESQYKKFSALYRMTFDEALVQFQDQSVDLLHIDGLHTYEAVRHDFESWLPKLAPGALVLFHDIKVSHGEFGVWKFWAEVKEKYPQNFEFRHSHGLGVIELSGSAREDDLVWLREGTAEKKNLLEEMSANAESLMVKVRNKELEGLASTAQTQADQPKIERPLNLEFFFAQEGKKISEEQKISEPAVWRINQQSQIKILLSGNAARSVLWRIDLGAEACLIRIHQVEFLGKNGKSIWRLTDHSNEVVIGGTAERLKDDDFVIFSFGVDPHVFLPKLQLLPGQELYEMQITLETLNTNDYLPFLARRRHELESQSRSALAKGSAALKQKEKETAQMRQELEAQKVATAKGVKDLGDSLAGLKQELIHELRTIVGELSERQDLITQTNIADMAVLRASQERSEVAQGSKIETLANFAVQMHTAVVAPSSSLVPAPFSWYSYLYQMTKIKKPSWIKSPQKLVVTPARPGFWRRLERSIRKRRKRWIARIGFDKKWYLNEYPDVAASKVDPWLHYKDWGIHEGRYKSKKQKNLLKKNL